MSEGIAHGVYTPAASRHQPAYGDGRLASEPPAKADEHLQRVTHLSLARAIFAPVVAAYVVAAYVIYRVVGGLLLSATRSAHP